MNIGDNMNIEDHLIEQRTDLDDSKKKQSKEIFALFRKLASQLIDEDKVIVLNALGLLDEFFLRELKKEQKVITDQQKPCLVCKNEMVACVCMAADEA